MSNLNRHINELKDKGFTVMKVSDRTSQYLCKHFKNQLKFKRKKDDIDGIKSFDVMKTSRNSFAILELSKSVDRTGILNELLSTDQFNYFEFDQQLSII